MQILFYVVTALLLIGSFCLGYLTRRFKARRQTEKAGDKAEKILNEAKSKEKDILLKAQDKAFKMIEESKEDERKRRAELAGLQDRLEQREGTFSKKLLELQDKQQELYDRVNKVEEAKEKIRQIKEEQLEKLKTISEMTRDEAREVLFKNVEIEAKDDLVARMRKAEYENDDIIENKAKELIASSMQRVVSTYTPEISTTNVDLPSDEMKGRVIGREGRNIKVIEQLTGVEIIVDDTPNTITISAFSPIRRHIAKRALDSLIKDGRIHPTKIEEAIEKAKKELALDIKKAGEEAIYEVGVAGFDPKLVSILGRLKYRTSYGQNALRHSVEVAVLSGLLAEELGVDAPLAKKAGLLHDIGKAVDHEVQGTHPEIGRDIAKKFNIPQEVIDPIETHHDDHPRGIIAVVVKVADAISASRPGVRSDTFERYIQRLEELEGLATSFEGVEKVYALQAGREVRVFVTAEKLDDLASAKLARDIAKKIEEELKYPGEIKVNVIRETRIIEYAR
ncbi:MAG: ribonuclease Y [Patescibacteria group bacterium]|jgi:ribonuclease Y